MIYSKTRVRFWNRLGKIKLVLNMEMKDFLKKSYIQILILFVTLGLYLATNNPVFGALIALEIVAMVILEVIEGKEKHGWKNELKETLIAIVIAVGVWFGAQFLLNTNAPISAVVTCSMLPNLERGDFAIVQGSEPKVHELEISKDELNEIFGTQAKIIIEGKEANVKGSIYSYCSYVLAQINHEDLQLCKEFFYTNQSKFEEYRGLLRFNYGACERRYKDGNAVKEVCVESVEVNGVNYTQTNSNDVIVYQPSKNEIYSLSGDIIHRAYFKLKVKETGEFYYLTKGDNNPILDIQVYEYGRGMGNDPISKEKLKGKLVFRVPLLGYFKLFISGFFQEPDQCRWQLN